ncbi:MAG: hypothetical protein EAY66_05880 [Sphingobacteriales bacterium]|jgi:hypothetical protein|nr:MAG: hypothetical protein EAY66_05880 [Sphingobacteriales bacterium]
MIHKTIIPQQCTLDVSFTLPKTYVGKEIELVAFIKQNGLNEQATQKTSPALMGSPLSNQEFLNWVQQAENTNTISLQEAKDKWAIKKEQLLQMTK